MESLAGPTSAPSLRRQQNVGICLLFQVHIFSGQAHCLTLMSLEELSELVKDSVEPLKEQAEQRLDELSVLLKQTTSTLNCWDAETDETVILIHKTRDEHVCFFILQETSSSKSLQTPWSCHITLTSMLFFF